MEVPARKLTKAEIVWLAENYCRHRHTYLSHYSCFLSEKPDTSPLREKVGVFDLESTGLKSNWSHMLAWCIKEHNKDVIYEDVVTTREARDKNDKRIVKSAVSKIKEFDRTCGWYSSQFDIPYLRSRAIYHGINFPGYKEGLYHTDLYYIARAKLALHSNRLQAVCEYFGIPAKGHRMTPDLWRRAGAGQSEALATVLEHCREDVRSTDQVFLLLLKHLQLQKRSI